MTTMSPPLKLNIQTLATKAMLVKLTSSKPTTARREKAAESIIQGQMGDTSLTVSSHIFKHKKNPVRLLLNEAGAVYSYHIAHTLAWEDRGDRMLPVDSYDTYSNEMRRLIAGVESSVHALASTYDALVQQDIAERSATSAAARDFSADYPSYEEFKEKMKFTFLFKPLPDASHFLFDVSEDDKVALAEQIAQAEQNGKLQVASNLHGPVVKLIEKLKLGINTEGSIFRDSAVNNIVEQCELAESLAMGDETLLSMVAEVRKAIRPHALNISALRESPVVRAEAAAKLAAVAARMSFMAGG